MSTPVTLVSMNTIATALSGLLVLSGSATSGAVISGIAVVGIFQSINGGSAGGAVPPTSVTWKATNMVEWNPFGTGAHNGFLSSLHCSLSIWYLVAPATGLGTVQATWAAATPGKTASVFFTCSNVDQNAPFYNAGSSTNGATTNNPQVIGIGGGNTNGDMDFNLYSMFTPFTSGEFTAPVWRDNSGGSHAMTYTNMPGTFSGTVAGVASNGCAVFNGVVPGCSDMEYTNATTGGGDEYIAINGSLKQPNGPLAYSSKDFKREQTDDSLMGLQSGFRQWRARMRGLRTTYSFA